MPIRVFIYEDQPDLREGLNRMLTADSAFEVCGASSNCDLAQAEMEVWQPDVVLMDFEMPGTNGLEGLALIKKKFPSIKVIMLTVFDEDEKVYQCICEGADGYLLKSTPPDKIVNAIHEVMSGGAPLTSAVAKKILQRFPRPPSSNDDSNLSPREKEVLSLLVKGYSYKMIASELKVSIDTINTHIKRIYQKLHVNSAREAVFHATKNRLV